MATEASGAVTSPQWWDDYWGRISLPAEVNPASTYVGAILRALERHLPRGAGLSALELGAAPGRFLVHLHRRFGYEVRAVEYSPLGCELLRRNLNMLGVRAEIHPGDALDPGLRVEPADVVYSLGLIEHYHDTGAVARAHLRCVRPGGVVAIGAPNLLGLNRRLHRWLAPSVLESHLAATTDLRRWREFERALGLEPLFRGYVGGFEPGHFIHQVERRGPGPWALWMTLRGLRRALEPKAARALRRLNSRLWSGYVLAVYRAPGPPPSGGAA